MARYLLGETEAETERLRAQSVALPAADRIRWAGLTTGMHAVDAGCGPGEIARDMARISGRAGSVLAFDLSRARLDAATARSVEPEWAPLTFVEGDLYAPPVPAGSADFLFSQFVFEYLREPARALAALIDKVRPGGIVCLTDADDIGGINSPLDESVAGGLRRLLAAATETTGFDPYAGRKLYTWMYDAGLTDLRVRIDTMVSVGVAPDEEIANWQQRFASQAPLAERAFGNSTAYESFVVGFLNMLKDPRALKFTNIVTVAGRRP